MGDGREVDLDETRRRWDGKGMWAEDSDFSGGGEREVRYCWQNATIEDKDEREESASRVWSAFSPHRLPTM